MEAKHTPGPWRVGVGVDNGLPCVDTTDADGFTVEVCEVWGQDDDKVEDAECRANARLIASAPELLEDAVRRVRECGGCNGTGGIRKPHGFFIVEADCPTCSQTRAIIAKATQP